MNDEDKLLWMFKEVHGEITGACYIEVECDDMGDPIAVHCMKDGNLCWTKTKLDLVFEYLTKHLDAKDTTNIDSSSAVMCQKCYKQEATYQESDGTYVCTGCYLFTIE